MVHAKLVGAAVSAATGIAASAWALVKELKSVKAASAAEAHFNGILDEYNTYSTEVAAVIGKLADERLSAVRRHLPRIRDAARHLNPDEVSFETGGFFDLMLFDKEGAVRIGEFVSQAQSICADDQMTALARFAGFSAARASAGVVSAVAATAATTAVASALGVLFAAAQIWTATRNARKNHERAAAFIAAGEELRLRMTKLSAVKDRAIELSRALTEISYQTHKYTLLLQGLNHNFESAEKTQTTFYNELSTSARKFVQQFVISAQGLWELLDTPLMDAEGNATRDNTDGRRMA